MITTRTATTMRQRRVILRPTQLCWLLCLSVLLQSSSFHHSVVVHAQQQQQPPMQLRQQQPQRQQQEQPAAEANLLDPSKCLDGTDRSLVDATISAVAPTDVNNDEEEQPLFIVESAPSTNQDLDDTDNGEKEEEEEDPLLQLLPGTDKKVYVRADVATFYRQPPEVKQQPVKFQAVMNRNGGGSDSGEGDGAAAATIQRKEQEEVQPLLLVEKEPKFQGMAGKFVNMSPERVQLYWNGGNDKPLVFIANIGPFCAGGTATFPLHKFVLKHAGSSEEDVICDFNIKKGTSVYYYDPYKEQDGTDVARCVPRSNYTTVRDLSELSVENVEKYRAHVYNFQFGAMYKNFTGGQEWLSMYPRNPPRHHIWRADYFGQQHVVATREMHFIQQPPAERVRGQLREIGDLTIDEMRRSNNDSDAQLPLVEYRQVGTSMNLTLTAISCAPRAFEIKNFLSDVEVDHILELVAQQEMERSTTGGHLSDTRTSTTTWIPRYTDHVMNAVIRRAADVLRVDEALMRNRLEHERPDMPNRRAINEDMQIVHYDPGQEYTAHHDFGYYNGLTDSPTRSINVAMYLNTVQKGGETTFPRWRNAETTDALKVKPEKGKALIFFMTLPDGNLDDLTQHAALPVLQGEKYFANLWLHDPYKR